MPDNLPVWPPPKLPGPMPMPATEPTKGPLPNGKNGPLAQPMSNEHVRENMSILGIDAHKQDATGLILLSEVKPEKVDWLWYGRIPYGKLTVLDGDPGLGKSTMLLDIAARLTTGTPMPGEKHRPVKAGVLLLSAEDGPGDTIVPRLIAAGADLTQVRLRQTVRDDRGERLPAIPTDLATIEIDVQVMGAALIIIDPLMAYLGDNTNASRDQDIRRALAPFAAMAESTGAAIVVIRHLNKATGGNAIYRGGGSIGIIGAARSGLLVAEDPEDVTERRRILASQKCNLAETPPALAYHMETAENDNVRIVWEGITNHTANGLLSGPVDISDKPALNEASTFLKDLLCEGPKAVTEIKKEARAAGISDITLRRAKDILGIQAKRTAFGAEGFWIWDIPDRPDDHHEQLSDMDDPYESLFNEHLNEDDH